MTSPTAASAPAATFDIAIIGAGIVGASVAWHLSRGPQAPKVLLLEAEGHPGVHATGRSAALFAEGYGPPGVRALTRASRAFYENPPPGFCSHPLLRQRGVLFVGSAAQREQAQALHAELLREGIQARWLEGSEACARVPVLQREAAAVAVLDPGAADIEVDALLQGFLRGARVAGTQWMANVRVNALQHDGQAWTIQTGQNNALRARVLVNASGAWLDEVARLAGAAPVQLQPKRRTAFVFEAPSEHPTGAWPGVVDLDEQWYIKPDAGLLLGSPANEDPALPHDVQPEEWDVALGIHRIEAATTLRIRRPRRSWAGLRSFVPDGEPVCGFDPQVPGFFWAGAVGGYGIQTAPAFGRLSATLLLGQAMPADLAAQALNLAALQPR